MMVWMLAPVQHDTENSRCTLASALKRPWKRRLKFLRGIGFGQPQHGLDHGEKIVRPVIDFAGQQRHALLGLLAGGDVDQHVHGAEHLPSASRSGVG